MQIVYFGDNLHEMLKPVFLWQFAWYVKTCLSPKETICIKYQNVFSGEYKKNIIILSAAELAERVVKVKY